MDKENNTLGLILKRNWLFIVVMIALLIVIPFACIEPVKKAVNNYTSKNQLTKEISDKQNELDNIIAENKRKADAAKKATVKEFFIVQGNDDVRIAYAPLFDNIITMIKQNGLRMKSIRYLNSIDNDNLVKAGGGAYSGCQADFVLVGYYEQFANFLNELDLYPYFISVGNFKVTPYQYDKRILIGEISILFYSKRQ